MKMSQWYSHLNGIEFLIVHKKNILIELENIIAAVNASDAFNKISKEKNKIGQRLYSPQVSPFNTICTSSTHFFSSAATLTSASRLFRCTV